MERHFEKRIVFDQDDCGGEGAWWVVDFDLDYDRIDYWLHAFESKEQAQRWLDWILTKTES